MKWRCRLYRALIIKGKARPGQTVLVHGASGGVGIAAVQIAASLGLRIIGSPRAPAPKGQLFSSCPIGSFTRLPLQ